jgi:hypothetical protein
MAKIVAVDASVGPTGVYQGRLDFYAQYNVGLRAGMSILGTSTSGCNVGIGTTSPVCKLDVEGGPIKTYTGSDGARIIMGPSPSGTNLDYCSLIESISSSASNYASILKFYTHGNGTTGSDPTLAMTINSAQQVGIGTTNPTSALQVAGDVVCAGTLSAGNPLMFRNALYNGDMRISQRGTSFTNPSSQYTLDRWYISIYGSTGNGTVSQIQSGLANFSNAFQLATTSTTAGNWYISQSLETRDVVRFQGQAVTVSFWYRIPTNFTQVWTPYLFWTTSIDTAITNSSSPAPNTAGSGTMPNTTAWTYTSFQASVPVSAEALSVMFVTFLNVVNGATIQITGVQLEKGSVATPYEILPYATELALCQRYYQKSYQQGDYAGTVTSTNGIIAVSAVNVDSIAGTRFNVPMRATPGTTTIYSTAGTAGKATVFNGGADTSAITTTYATNVGIGYLYINAANLTQGNGYRYHYVADADL